MKCGEIFEDNDQRILKGCPKCGGHLFVYVPEKGAKAPERKVERKLKIKEIEAKIEKEKSEGAVQVSKDEVATIVIEEGGKYIIDVEALLKGHPIVLRKASSYRIYLPSLFSKKGEKE